MLKKFCTLFFVLLVSFVSIAQEKIDHQVMQRIKREGLENSKVMEYLSYLTDIYSPRLAGSDQYREAGKWIISSMNELGLQNARMESWGTFGRGWELKKFYFAMTEPQYMPIIGYPKAWTPGLNGTLEGPPVLMEIKKEEDLQPFKGKLKNAIVFVQGEQEVQTSFEPDAKRYTDEELKQLENLPEPGGRSPFANRMEEFMARNRLRQAISSFLISEGAAVTVEPAQGRYGTVFVQSGGSYRKGSPDVIPQIAIAVEHYNRIVRILKQNVPVKLEMEYRADFVDTDSLGYNIIAEIPGTDKKLKDEIVILGGHFDTWHAGTGATDNSAGCAVALEALRILKAIGIQPRRTIRIAMWDAEEVGLVGSREYVKNHFFDRDKKEKKPDYDKLSAYFNYDNGAGRIRGIYTQGNEAVLPIFQEWLKPFHSLGAATVTIRNTGGTDHQSFDGAGLPGFQFIQDELHYDTRTHHSNMDVYDLTIRGDLMQSAVIMAAFVYNASMRDEKLPRKYFDPNEERPRRPRF
ncbi:MAG TPA: M20/M25/M40 family metallo-hydrolase [Melioribacteraceae bacterium]|nr:M20/M25/M40 family metallo-hydrolase [Melioribacteraceae bacterium]